MSDLNLVITIEDVPEQPVVFISMASRYETIANDISRGIGKTVQIANESGITIVGPPFVRYPIWDENGGTIECGFPVIRSASVMEPGEAGTIGGITCLMGTLQGHYSIIPEAYGKLFEYLDMEGLNRTGPCWEVYVTEPATTPDPNDWITRIHIGIVAPATV